MKTAEEILKEKCLKVANLNSFMLEVEDAMEAYARLKVKERDEQILDFAYMDEFVVANYRVVRVDKLEQFLSQPSNTEPK